MLGDRLLTRVSPLLALAVLVPLTAQAQQSVHPKVKAAIEERRKDCAASGEKLVMQKGFITRRDINEDGVDDYIVDYENAACGEFSSFFCGTGGCVFQVFASVYGDDYIKVMDDNAYSVNFQKMKGRTAMVQYLHGTNCGRVGADGGCRSVTYWNGSRFSPAVPVR